MNEANLDSGKGQTHNDAFVVHRSVRLKDAPEKPRELLDLLLKSDAVRAADLDVKARLLRISYDASACIFSDVQKLLEETGNPISEHWWEKVKVGWYQYLDENAQANAKSKGGACCSNPSDIYANRKK